MLFTPQLVIGEERSWHGQVHANDSNWSIQDVHAHNFNGLHHGEEKSRLRAFQRAKLSQLGDLFFCTLSLVMYEVFNPTLLVAFFQIKKIGPMQMNFFFSNTRLYENLFMFFLWCNILV